MTLALVVEPLAQDDIDAHTVYSDDHYPAGGDRFLSELTHILDRLTTFPAFGQARPTPNHPDLRRVPLPTLTFSVFYRPTEATIIVERVLHHARNLRPLLDEP